MNDDFVAEQNRMWSTRYEEVGQNFLFGTEPNHFLANQKERFIPGEKVLSVADGEGRNSVWLASQGLQVSAVEISAVAVEKARRLAKMRGVTVDFCCGDMLTEEWRTPQTPALFDWVVGIFIQFAPPVLRQRQFEQIRTLLKPGGQILLQGYTPKQLEYKTGGPSAVENLYTEEILRQAWKDYTIEYLETYEDTLSEGSGHHGPSALIGMIARKPEQ
ncbi:SAM-dependent methyltransferase [Ferrovum myxofaciens]|uniref:SAM-dependent methyltransferase n=1 Tax=Ferrovum myxofaciens TaxID=416213 RepID=UPI002356F86A|nr:class I SAM-dependent methyltransferase [Ferrovum myxofaciens]MBU6993796.1 class I SAM-dependent methyltransferase [Ferrovum myxofaciens]